MPLNAKTTALALSLSVALPAVTRAQDAPPPPPPPAEPAPAPEALDKRVDDIDRRSLITERKLELLAEAAAARKAADPVLTANDRGFGWKSADNAFAIKLGAILHIDGRWFFDDKALAGSADTFTVRKARPVLQASFFDVADVRLMPELAGAAASLWDAYVDLRVLPFLTIRGGKFKTALALERYQSETAVLFPERAFPTALAPNRDTGFALVGTFLGGAVLFEGGVFNGAADNAVEDTDLNHAKDFAGRLFLQPFKSDPHSLLANLGVGIGAGTGNQKGRPAELPPRARASASGLGGYRSPGQQQFFSYSVNDAVADGTTLLKGRRTRWSPQGYWYVGGLGLLGEFIQNRQKVVKGTSTATLRHQAWQVAGSYVFGGRPLFEGVVVGKPFDPRKGQWGALELGARYHALDLDDDTFTAYAGAASAATEAKAWGAVLNWHWSRNVKLTATFEQTRFTGGAAAGADRKTENVLIHRLQGAF